MSAGTASLISFRDQVIADRREAAARAIQEYRRYIAAHGERDPLSQQLAAIVRTMHSRLHDRRRVLREIGWDHLEKANPV